MTRRDRLLILGFWTFMGFVESSKAYLTIRLRGLPLGVSDAFIGNMPWWLLWALLTPVAFWLAQRFRFDSGARWRSALVHIAAAVVLSAVHLAVAGGLYFYTNTRGLGMFTTPWGQIQGILNAYFATDVLTYFAVIGGYYAIEFYGRFRERELAAAQLAVKAARLEASMTEARLSALRMQLNPHFLFNTLNAISGLVRRHEDSQAVSMLARLADLLRITLEKRDEQEVPLAEERDFLREYLEIEQIRFHDRLTVDVEMSDEALGALVPPLLLQPIVENALRHGVAHTTGPAHVAVRAHRHGHTLRLIVTDTGPGLARGATTQEGVGLGNTRARLEQLYGAAGSLVLENAPEGGARATIVLPFRPAPAQPVEKRVSPAPAQVGP